MALSLELGDRSINALFNGLDYLKGIVFVPSGRC